MFRQVGELVKVYPFTPIHLRYIKASGMEHEQNPQDGVQIVGGSSKGLAQQLCEKNS